MNGNKIEYAYLHCHTIYSVRDALPTHKDYVDAIYRYNQISQKYKCLGFAGTDHGSIGGLVKQYNACNHPDAAERKTKAIYGCEIYMTEDLMSSVKNRYHLILLASTQEGLVNLYKITSHAGINAQWGRQKAFPTTDLKYLSKHGKGIICLTACVAGIVPSHILKGEDNEALKLIDQFASWFDDVYLEVQPLDFAEQYMVNAKLVEFSQKYGYKLAMTCDSHYIDKNDDLYHKILKNMSHQPEFITDNHLYTPEEMEKYCMKHGIPVECISNTGIIANQCNVDPKPKDHNALLPVFPCPPGYNEDTYLRKLSFDMLSEKIVKRKISNPMRYFTQMNYELDVICNAGFAGYFLILWDWFEWCRANDILTGPGRGSAAGSIVSYALNITKVDPIKHKFYFERFLNPGRVEFPDIDTDIPRDKRSEAIEYLQQRYGKRNVSQIITYGTYKLKNTVKAILSYLNVDFNESNEVTKSIPDLIDGKAVDFDLLEGFHNNPDDDRYASFSDTDKNTLERVYDKLEKVFQKYPIAYQGVTHCCGTINSTGIHAGGIIVCRYPINEHGALIDGGPSAVLPLLQFEMADLDFFGFLKIDGLGLKTLDIIKLTMDMAGLGYDWYDSEDYEDKGVYDMLRDGQTTDVFQMAKFSPTKMISDFHVTDIDGLCAVNAGNRPGPLEKDSVTGKSMVDRYIEAVSSGVDEHIHEDVDDILKDNHGLIWYQEHLMAIGQVLAGYDLGGSDLRIRKILGKKKVKQIPEIRNEFIYGKKSVFNENHEVIGISKEPSEWCEGAIARGYDVKMVSDLFNVMEAFAKYSFNRSHKNVWL